MPDNLSFLSIPPDFRASNNFRPLKQESVFLLSSRPSLRRRGNTHAYHSRRTLIDVQYHLSPPLKMKLPTEIFLQVLQNLTNSDLKVVRLASKESSACAAEFLFRKMYISKQKEDLDAFKEFTNHPLIRKCVRTLEYDAVGFPPDLSESEYYRVLWYQVRSLLYITQESRRKTFVSPDPQINEFMSHCSNGHTIVWDDDLDIQERYRTAHEEDFKDFTFIKEGYRKWMERGSFEKLHMQDPDFLGVLVPGLQRLDHLDSVNLNGEWPHRWVSLGNSFAQRLSGSILKRNWDSFCVFPMPWHNPFSDPSYGSTVPFWTITSALYMASKQPRVFHCESWISPSAFEVTAESSRPDNGMLVSGCKVVACLQRLSLCLAKVPSDDLHELVWYDNLSAAQDLLRHMPRLRTLELNLPWDDWRRSARDKSVKMPTFKSFKYDLIFPRSRIWKSLTTVSIGCFTMHLHELVELLFIKVPNLRRVKLDDIRLLEGTWQAVIELFKYGLRSLEEFHIDEVTQLFHCEQTNVLVPWELQEMSVDLENYILNGRDNLKLRHPCLRPEDPIQKSFEYLPELYREFERKDRQGSLAAKIVQSQIDYSTQAYQQWNLMNPENIVDEQA